MTQHSDEAVEHVARALDKAAFHSPRRSQTRDQYYIYLATAALSAIPAAEERAAIVEECAKIAESKMQFDVHGNRAWWYGDGNGACLSIAAAIRALTGGPHVG